MRIILETWRYISCWKSHVISLDFLISYGVSPLSNVCCKVKMLLGWLTDNKRICFNRWGCSSYDHHMDSWQWGSEYSVNRDHISHNTPHWNRKVYISVPRWCIVGYRTGTLWDLWNRSFATSAVKYLYNMVICFQPKHNIQPIACPWGWGMGLSFMNVWSVFYHWLAVCETILL